MFVDKDYQNLYIMLVDNLYDMLVFKKVLKKFQDKQKIIKNIKELVHPVSFI
jgi:hypothetical protein